MAVLKVYADISEVERLAERQRRGNGRWKREDKKRSGAVSKETVKSAPLGKRSLRRLL